MEYTSRGFIIDKIQSIGAQMAAASHLLEKINKLKTFFPEKVLTPQGEVANQEELDSAGTRLVLLQEERQLLVQSRRKKMAEIEALFTEADHEWWCDFKHAIEDLQYSTEVYDASGLEQDLVHVIAAFKHLAFVMKEMFGIDVPACWPCLADRLLSK